MEKEAFPGNSIVFVDLWVSTNFGVSNRNWGLNFYYRIIEAPFF